MSVLVLLLLLVGAYLMGLVVGYLWGFGQGRRLERAARLKERLRNEANEA